MVLAMQPINRDRAHELQHIDFDGFLVEGFATDNPEGFEAKLQTVVESIQIGQQVIVFTAGSPRYVIELDFDGNQVISEVL